MSVEPPGAAGDGPVTVERSITVKEEGVIVELTARAEAPTAVRITDELPATVGPNEVGFHPDHAPDEGEATDELVTVEGSVDPDAPLTVVYGAYLDTSEIDRDGLDASTLSVDADPAARPDASSPSGLRGYVSGLFGGGRGDEEPDTDARTDDPESDVDDLDGFDDEDADDEASETLDIEAAEAATAAADAEQGGDAATAEEPDAPATEEVGTEADGSDDDAEEPAEPDVEPAIVAVADDAAESVDDEDEVDATDEGSDELDADGEDADGADDDTDTMSDTTTADDGEEQGAVTDATAGEGESLAAALAAELEAGAVDDETRETLARELGGELSGSESARLDHVQRKVDDLAAYTDSLEELLDEEGRPAAVVADLRAEIGDVRAEVGEVRTATGELREDLDETEAELEGVVDEEITRLEAGFDEAAADRNAIRDELESTTAELSTAREELGDEVATLRDDLTAELERVERQAREGRRDIAADVEELEAVAERVRSLQQALSSAFGGGVDVGEPAPEDADESDDTDDADEATEADADVSEANDIESRIREIETDED
jgi:predicted  nucleic acid-binding Zn-ribbon protein